MKFQTNFIFLINPFKYMTKKSRQKLEKKRNFHYFKGLLVAKSCLTPESAPLNISSYLWCIEQFSLSVPSGRRFLTNILIFVQTSKAKRV